MLLYLFLASGLVLTVLALPLIAEKIKPNPLYGVRLQQTFDDPVVWYATNKYFGKRLLVVGLVILVASTGLYFWPGISLDAYSLILLGIFMIVFGIAMVQTLMYMKSLRQGG